MNDIEIRMARRKDCHDLAPRLRDEDVKELDAAVGLAPAGALVMSYLMSDLAYAVVINGQVEALFGVVSDRNEPNHGVPWLLGSYELENNARPFLRIGRRYIKMMAVLYDSLRNAVHHEHTQSFTLLEHLGFVRTDVLEGFGVRKETFFLYVYV